MPDLVSLSSMKAVASVLGNFMGTGNTQTVTGLTTFNNNILSLWNPAGTFKYILSTSAIITADKTITIPLLTADGNMVIDSFANIFSVAQTLNNNIQLRWKDTVGGNQQALIWTAGNNLVLGTTNAQMLNIYIYCGNATEAFKIDNTRQVFTSPTWAVSQLFNNNINVLAKDIGGTSRQVFKLNTANRLIFGDTAGILEFQIITGGTLGSVLFDVNTKMTHTVAAQAAVAETLATWSVSDDTTVFNIRNALSTDLVFSPWVTGSLGSGHTNTTNALRISGFIPTAGDTGLVPAIRIDASLQSGALLVTRPILDINNVSTNVLRINAKGDQIQTIIAQVGVAEILSVWKVSDDASSELSIRNFYSTDANFAPWIRSYFAGAVNSIAALTVHGYIAVAQDTGTFPVFLFDARKIDETAITTRPLLRIRTVSNNVFDINANGNILQTKTADVGGYDTLHTWTVSDDTGSILQIINGQNVDGQFIPFILTSTSVNVVTTAAAFYIRTQMPSASDVGTTPMCMWDFRMSGLNIAVRPLIDFKNMNTSVFKINAKGDVLQAMIAGGAEVLHKWTVSDAAASYFRIENNTGTDAIFSPRLQGYNADISTYPGIGIIGMINDTHDSGSVAAIEFRARLDTIAALAVRPILRVINNAVDVFTIFPTYFDFEGLEIRAARGVQAMPSVKTTGVFAGHNVSLTNGLLAGEGLLKYVETFGTIGHTRSLTEGNAFTFSTSTTINTIAGIRFPGYASGDTMYLDWNPRAKFRVKISQVTNCRVLIGNWSGLLQPMDEDPLNALYGFAIGKLAADTNWRIFYNNGVGVTSNIDSGIVITAGVVYTLEIIGDIVGVRWGWSINESAFSYITSDIPLTGVSQQYKCLCKNTDASDKILSVYYVQNEQDK